MSIKKIVSAALMLTMLLMLFGTVSPKPAYAADEFDSLREKWKALLTGGSGYNASDPDIAAQLTAIADKAQANWDAMDKTPGSYLWSDLASATSSAQITSGYTRLREMALGYASKGSALYQNNALKNDILIGLDWMYANRYNENKTTYGNWWDWEIGAPMALNDTAVLMYDQLTPARIANYMNAVGHFQPTVTMTGANRVWECTVIALRGILIKNSAEITKARNGIGPVFNYATSGDGFYRDGSFIQHNFYSYNGGYGRALLSDLSKVMYVLEGSEWAVTDPDKKNMYSWVYDSFEPLIYKGAMMDMTRGREISRHYQESHQAGHGVIQAILRIAQFAPAEEADRMKRMVKSWVQQDTFRNFFAAAPIHSIVLGKSVLNDASVIPREELTGYRLFPAMDRAVQLRPGFGFAISAHSSRIANYESFSNENLKGWYTGEGMTYLYNGDLGQFSDGFWPTVNAYRLPGTTVQQNTTVGPAFKSTKNWVGGTEIAGTFGSMGMELVRSSSLSMKKSWFMFDDEIVALGAGISGTNGKTIETIVDNRKLQSSGGNTLTVNGSAKPATLGWTENMTGVQWAHLTGNVSGSDIGYYFPGAANVRGLREARTGAWSDIDARATTPTTPMTRNYMTLWFNHGVNPANAAYSYVLLPGKTAAQVGAYAGNPDITVLENTPDAQAVRENTQQVTGIHYWNDTVKTAAGVTSNKKAAVMLKETSGGLEVAVSDPTQANTGSIQLELNRSMGAVVRADSGITVTQLSPTIKLSVNVNGAKGKTFKVEFSSDDPGEFIVDNTAAELTGTWVSSTGLPNYYGSDYLYKHTGTGAGKAIWRPTLSSAGNYAVYYRLPDGNSGRATNAPFRIQYNGGSKLYTVNQQTVPGGSWILLGTHPFSAGTSGYVELTDNANGTYVIADAVKFVKQPEIVIDNTEAELTGTWVSSTGLPNYYGSDYLYKHTGTGAGKAIWRPSLSSAGSYSVYYRLPDGNSGRATNAPFRIHYNGGSQLYTVNQQTIPGGSWILLGTHPFSAGTTGYVELTDNANGTYVNADAVKFVRN
ncbi:hyaluronate lyase [Paenibacillus sp. UNCCL117]|uniref:polysaccharide lyase family 8 super-sandwich domain-containing protein n=1 Tax=unclassified Paenibacillus TaxID=185978 RepID=UPI000880C386|nr:MULTISPECIES: polysaccharide lyase family 8 super-sandwich domain-containing protein [unclassified Paenibacillus]SDD65762.1 hyaluronate lyase [Paenibacillus sp. cl123]SFW58063.1 hyaluronate lyase [Paenibacillus sp. UNCCL117]